MSERWGRERFVALDGLRGIAALVVVLGHRLPSNTLPNMPLAVDFFFALSGFVLTHGFGAKLGNGLSFPAYLEQRLIRLMPLVAFGTLLGALAFWNVHGALGALLVPVAGPLLYPLNPPAWSLLFEMIGSVLIGVGLWRRAAWLGWALVIASAAAMGIGIVHHGSIDNGMSLGSVHYGLARMLFGFSIGVLTYRYAPRFAAPRTLVLALFAAVLLCPLQSVPLQLAAVYLWVPAVLVMAANTRTFWGARLLGDLSFPIYIVHYPLLVMLDKLPWRIDWGVQIGIICAVSWLALRLFDEPLRRHLNCRRRPGLQGAALTSP